MRQTSVFRICHGLKKLLFFVILLLFSCITSKLLAEITGPLEVTTSFPGGNRLNSAGYIGLSCNWQSDSPQSIIRYKKGSNVIRSDTVLSGNSHSTQITAIEWGDTNGNSETVTVEVDDGSGASTAQSNSFIVDTQAPTLTPTITNGPNFSANSTVRIQITSNEEVGNVSVTCEGKDAALEGTLNTGTAFVFNLDLGGTFSNGLHQIDISATDMTQPSANANRGTTSITFTVGTSSSGATTINPLTSPTNAQTVTLSGQAPTGVAKIALFDGTSEVQAVNTTNTTWQLVIQPAVGSHSYSVVSYDALDQEISRSAPVPLLVDRTAPAVPTFDASGAPAQTNAPSYTFTVDIANYMEESATPVYLQAYVNGVASGTRYNVTTTGSPVQAIVPLGNGTNVITFRSIDGVGNMSADSNSVTINKNDDGSTVNVATALIDNFSYPAPPEAYLGHGEHKLTFNFNQSLNPTEVTIEINCGGGGKLTAVPTWTSPQILTATFTIPLNGGSTIDGRASIVIKDLVDTFGNSVSPQTFDSAFTIDSTAPVSAITTNSPVYLSSSNTNIALTGTIDDGTITSGIDHMDLLVVNATTGASQTHPIPLQTMKPNPWSYNLNFNDLGLTLSSSDVYELYTFATDRAQNMPNTENPIGSKTPLRVLVDVDAPDVLRISFNNTGIDIIDMIASGSEIVPTIASDITRIVAVATDTGSGLDLTSPNYIFTVTTPSGTQVTGEKTNNNLDTIYFDFQVLSENGTYTINVRPVDKAGNVGPESSIRFALDKSAPEGAEFSPINQGVANKTHEELAQNQVRAVIASGSAVQPSYNLSTISVKYNGLEVGEKVNSETESLVARLHGGNLRDDGSHDGNYYITIVPRSNSGVTGQAITSSFIYDTLPPVVVESSIPLNTSTPSWFGLATTELRIKLSDAPKDILENYLWQYPSTFTPQIPGDSAWYSSNGSGISSISSISWTIQDATASETGTIIGNTMIIRLPNIDDASSTSGVASIGLEIITADLVNQGTSIPNTNRFVQTIYFDFVRPGISISENFKENQKYCKNIVSISGVASDTGNGAQVVKVEYSTDNGVSWINCPITPSSSVNFKIDIDISNKKDGSNTIKYRAVDLAGNYSEEKEWSYIVDRTPPETPELTVPLADYAVNKRSQTFKWTAVASASAYVIQIADDSSFNNILNSQPNNDYPSLKGVISTITDGNYSLPKDGAFYWRVASLEKCADGYNISEFTETRKIIIDTVKPYILSVSPSPSSSNTVSTGMVTFTIRFNEAIDSTIDLQATLTSAGGQVMKIEKVSCTGDTWTGTTVIPKNNSAVYDGTGVIAVEGAADLAGNAMVSDSSHTIVINTGPAFVTKLFSNPANEYEITIITKSTESLQTAPSVTVKQNSVKTPVTMNFLKDKFYSGSYKIDKDNPGSAYIQISGTDLYGMVGNSTVEFVIADVNASVRLNITSATGRATLKAAQGSTYTPTSVYLISRDMLESPFATNSETTPAAIRASAGVRASTKTNKNSELVGILGLDQVGPSKTKLKKCMLYTADINGENIDTSKANKIHIYRQDSNGNWIFQGGELKNYKISAQITGLGRLALMSDTTAPKTSSFTPTNNSKLDTNYPEIKGQFTDNGSGLLPDSFKLYIDDLQVKNVEMNKDGTFNYQVKQSLKEGKHEIKYEVNDKAGNCLVRAVTVDAPPELRIGEFSPYPNPARGNRISFAYNFGVRPEKASLKVYDSAGHLVAKFDTEDFDRISGSIRWDLTNRKGKRIANGTYIYRLEVVANGQKIKRRGKLAVLK